MNILPKHIRNRCLSGHDATPDRCRDDRRRIDTVRIRNGGADRRGKDDDGVVNVSCRSSFDDDDSERFERIKQALLGRMMGEYDCRPEAFLDVSSVQHAALSWLTNDDPRRMDPESPYIAQRYGLALLWFGTNVGMAGGVRRLEGARDGADRGGKRGRG